MATSQILPRFALNNSLINFGISGLTQLFCYAPAVASRKRKHTIMLVGAGNLAQALGPALKKSGYSIDAVVARPKAESRRRAKSLAKKLGTKSCGLDEAEPVSGITWLLHTDDALGTTAETLAGKPGWRRKIVLHSSGALSSDVLAPLRRAGAHVASLHPMMTFVPGTAPDMSRVPFAVEGDAPAVTVAREIAKNLGAEAFTINKSSKVLYHALGSFSSPLVVATLVTAERVGRAAGLTLAQTRKIMAGILQQTMNNYLERGPAAAFSGPIKRGDLETVRRHLRELKRVPEASEVYRALVRSALRDLPSERKEELMSLLSEQSALSNQHSARKRSGLPRKNSGRERR